MGNGKVVLCLVGHKCNRDQSVLCESREGTLATRTRGSHGTSSEWGERIDKSTSAEKKNSELQEDGKGCVVVFHMMKTKHERRKQSLQRGELKRRGAWKAERRQLRTPVGRCGIGAARARVDLCVHHSPQRLTAVGQLRER